MQEADVAFGDILDMPRLLDLINRHKVTGIRHRTSYDISRARAELGYAPQYDPDKGIADDLDGLERLKAR